jgi:protein-arginine kinase activator protein McsA
MEDMFRVHICHTCPEPLANASGKAEHVFRGHQVESVTLHRRMRRQGSKVGVQWSSDWVLTDRKEAML